MGPHERTSIIIDQEHSKFLLFLRYKNEAWTMAMSCSTGPTRESIGDTSTSSFQSHKVSAYITYLRSLADHWQEIEGVLTALPREFRAVHNRQLRRFASHLSPIPLQELLLSSSHRFGSFQAKEKHTGRHERRGEVPVVITLICRAADGTTFISRPLNIYGRPISALYNNLDFSSCNDRLLTDIALSFFGVRLRQLHEPRRFACRSRIAFQTNLRVGGSFKQHIIHIKSQ